MFRFGILETLLAALNFLNVHFKNLNYKKTSIFHPNVFSDAISPTKIKKNPTTLENYLPKIATLFGF